ncbi:MAG: isoprenylcysteine carboxylmethyltransferase family protein [Lysobacterales bacterium]
MVAAVEKKRKIIPPVYALMALASIWLIHYFLPVYRYMHEPLTYAGVAAVFLGITMASISAEIFKRAGTGIVPFDEATTLVTNGFYRYSRNPMYLGMFLMVAGMAFLMGSVGAALPVVIFVLIIRNNFVLGEERFLEASFGQQYLDYKSKVRRWL